MVDKQKASKPWTLIKEAGGYLHLWYFKGSFLINIILRNNI